MSAKLTILLVDDDHTFRRVTQLQLEERGYRVITAENAKEGLEEFVAHRPDVVLTDVRMPGRSGVDLLLDLRSASPDAMVIVMTAYADVDTTIRTFKSGAFDFLPKPFTREKLFYTLDRAAEVLGLRRQVSELRRASVRDLRSLVGSSPAIAQVRTLVEKVARSNATVLITGESGTGKEIVARALHGESNRAGDPFVAIHCGAVPESLIESELFGHAAGAFTGAAGEHAGCFEAADGGTVFLDEIATMPPNLQGKLLRVLQEREVQRLGESTPRAVNIRVVAATNADIERLRDAGEFREDLFYRLNVVRVHIPPLRERREDIPLIARALLGRLGRPEVVLAESAQRKLAAWKWPGNVRELENVLERILIMLGESAEINGDDIPDFTGREPLPTGADPDETTTTDDVVVAGVRMALPRAGISLDQLERGLLRHALKVCENNQSRAARYLGIPRHKLRYRLRETPADE